MVWVDASPIPKGLFPRFHTVFVFGGCVYTRCLIGFTQKKDSNHGGVALAPDNHETTFGV